MIETKYLIDKGDKLVLPECVVPHLYDLHLTPNFNDFTFSGFVDISIRVLQPTKTIVIHSIDLVLQSAGIVSEQSAVSIEYYTPEQVAIINFKDELQPSDSNNKVLSIRFTGILNDKLKGFYRSSYKVDGEQRYIATTQFEATDARRSFPCFDEPALKAIFRINLTVQSNHIALSNMQEKSITEHSENSTKTYIFEDTPVMSTYLVAFCVGEFDYVESKTKQGIRVRVYQVPGKKKDGETGDFALQIAVDSLSYFIEYFDIPYPLTKCDHVGIPDFAFGAMENWGLITYRESTILSSKNTPVRRKKRIAYVIGHEVAHQWFGNLVSPAWWSQLWLNEGFATFMGNKVTDHLFPQWNVWIDYINNEAMELDCLANSHPVEVKVHSSSQIFEIFDGISYQKGSLIIRMLENRFGEQFRLGLSQYLKKHSFGNTTTEDLWQSISQATGTNVNDYMNNFTKKSGFPVLNFKRMESSKAGEKIFEVSQRQFRLSGEEQPDDPIWNCFVQIETNNGSFNFLLDQKVKTFCIPEFQWMKPNFGQSGYFRIEYDSEMIKSLIPSIKSLSLPATDRLGILSDTFGMCRAGIAPISMFMDLVSGFINETESAIWDSIVSKLGQLYDLSLGSSYSEKFKAFLLKLYKPIATKVGFLPPKDSLEESSGQALLRERIHITLGQLGDNHVVIQCRTYFNEFRDNLNKLQSDIKPYVLPTTIRHGNEVDQQCVIEEYRKSNVSADRNLYLRSLSSTTKPDMVKKALDFSLSSDVRSQDTYIGWIAIPTSAQPLVWDYFVSNFDSIKKVFGESRLIIRLISSSLPKRANATQIQFYQKFFSEHIIPVADRSTKQSLEDMENNERFFNSFNNVLGNWLNSNEK
ncbi:puromycin-sensitive aminopeptidase-like protein [Heterostelium album PN500]|uniref:Aminopeptidase n=1 Tax=Heterostelium pallidum (strain ATCC 26659 / Pp 5 / PN500) TaxID=670386 RepID=D3BLZ6_HETP5|nr:puromycin-sensitive aminopeptidase-like protein [Heterostelium album PN500]EFA77597.1 puromycin-sensitive aminopeptidase-like protein [Heterostelium album PN500]|eukprot:XP_020429725.1 puromycin-sensitive aminopeptidase-like protein [Heterostelium album PN500]